MSSRWKPGRETEFFLFHPILHNKRIPVKIHANPKHKARCREYKALFDGTLPPKDEYLPYLNIFSIIATDIIPFNDDYANRIRYLYMDRSGDQNLSWFHKPVSLLRELLFMESGEKFNRPYHTGPQTSDSIFVASNVNLLPVRENYVQAIIIIFLIPAIFISLILYLLVRKISNFLFMEDLLNPREQSVVVDGKLPGILPGKHLFYTGTVADIVLDCKQKKCLQILKSWVVLIPAVSTIISALLRIFDRFGDRVTESE